MGEAEIVKDYETSLTELVFNSKPHINLLTLLADEGHEYAADIVKLIEARIMQVEPNQKLPLLYLIDSILKNCSKAPYKELFARNIINTFLHVFDKGDEKVRASMFKLRNTWVQFGIFPISKLYAIDIKVHGVDPAWPLDDSPRAHSGASPSGSAIPHPPTPTASRATSIHVNPKFLTTKPIAVTAAVSTPSAVMPSFASEKTRRDAPRLETLQMLQQQKIQMHNQKSRDTLAQSQHGVVRREIMPRSQAVVRPVNAALLSTYTEGREVRLNRNQDTSKFSRSQSHDLVRDNKRVVVDISESPARPSDFVNSSARADVFNKPCSNAYNDNVRLKGVDSQSSDVACNKKRSPKPPPINAVPLKRAKIADETPGSASNVQLKKPSTAPPMFTHQPPRLIAQQPAFTASIEPGKWRMKDEAAHPEGPPMAHRPAAKKPKSPATVLTSNGRSVGGQKAGKEHHKSAVVNQMPAKLTNDAKQPAGQMPTPSIRVADKAGAAQQQRRAKEQTPTPVHFTQPDQQQLLAVVKAQMSPSIRSVEQGSGLEESDEEDEVEILHTKQASVSKSIPAVVTPQRPVGVISAQMCKVLASTDKPALAQELVTAFPRHGALDGDFRKLESTVKKPQPSPQTPAYVERPRKESPTQFSGRVPKKSDKRSDRHRNKDETRTRGPVPLMASIYPFSAVPPGFSRISAPVEGDRPKGTSRIAQATCDIDERILPHGDTDLRLPQTRSPAKQSVRRPTPPPAPEPSTRHTLPPKKRRRGGIYDGAGASDSDASLYRRRLPSPTSANPAPPSGRPAPASDRPAPPSDRKAPPQSYARVVPEVIPVNNYIFVDGVRYEVSYVNDTPVIRKDGRMHMLRFKGRGRPITIDSSTYFLRFDEPLDVTIDGYVHRIRFGGPARELYMGDYPFRGTFGGPPIYALINGVKHRIQLKGPAPEIDIDPSHASDLEKIEADQQAQQWAEQDRRPIPPGPPAPPRPPAPTGPPAHTGNATSSPKRLPLLNQPIVRPTAPPAPAFVPATVAGHFPALTASSEVAAPFRTVPAPLGPFGPATVPPAVSGGGPMQSGGSLPPPSGADAGPAPPSAAINVNELLNRLLSTGIIGLKGSPSGGAPVDQPAAARKTPEPAESSTSRAIYEIDTSIPTSKEPTAALQSFEMRGLRVRYTSVVEALYKGNGLLCSHCGMRFADSDNLKHSKHLDYHFKQNRLSKSPGKQSRIWYIASEDWANYEEYGDDKTPKAKSAVFEQQAARIKQEPAGRTIVASTNSVLTASREEYNQCSVCDEKFEQFWDEDEESWKLRNAMLINQKAYHPLCYQDTAESNDITVDEKANDSLNKASDGVDVKPL